MTMHSQMTVQEPTPDFDARCLNCVQRWQRGEMPQHQALAALRELAHEAQASQHAANQARAEHLQGYIEHYLGHYNTSVLHYERARQLYDAAHNERRVAAIDLNQGENFRLKGEFSRARRLYHSAFERARDLGDQRIQATAGVNEGLALTSMKDYSSALAALDEGLRLAAGLPEDTPGLLGLFCEAYQGLALIALAQNNPQTAWEHAQCALDYAQRSGDLLSTGYANRILGDALTALRGEGNPDEYYRAAMLAFQEGSMEGEEGKTLFAQGRSHSARGKNRSAAHLYRQAMVIFSRLGMIDDAARAAEAQLSVL